MLVGVPGASLGGMLGPVSGDKVKEQGGNVGAYLLVVVGVGLLAALIVTSFGRLNAAEPGPIPAAQAAPAVASEAPPPR